MEEKKTNVEEQDKNFITEFNDYFKNNERQIKQIFKLFYTQKTEEEKRRIVEENIDKKYRNEVIKIFEKTSNILNATYPSIEKALENSEKTITKVIDNEYGKTFLKSAIMVSGPFGPILNALDDQFGIIDKMNEKLKEKLEEKNKEKEETAYDKDMPEEQTIESKIIKDSSEILSQKLEEKNNLLIKEIRDLKNRIITVFKDILGIEEKLNTSIEDNTNTLNSFNEKEEIFRNKEKINDKETLEQLQNIEQAIKSQDQKEVKVELEQEESGGFFSFLSGLFTRIFGKGFSKTLSSVLKNVFGKGGALASLIGSVLPKPVKEKGGKILGKVGGALPILSKALKFIPWASAGISAIMGYQNAGEYFGKKQEDTTAEEKISSVVGGVVEGLTFGIIDGKFIAHLTKAIIDIGESILGGLKDFIFGIFESIFDSITDYFKKVGNFILGIFDPIINFFKNIGDFISNSFKKAFGWIGDIFKWLKPDFSSNPLENLIKTIFGLPGYLLSKLYGIVKNIFGDIFSSIKDFASKIPGVSNILDILSYIFSLPEKIVNFVYDKVSSVWKSIKDFFGFGDDEKEKSKMDVAEGDFFGDKKLPDVKKEANDKINDNLKSIKDVSSAALNAVKSFFGFGEDEKETSKADIAEGDFFEDESLPKVEKEAKDKTNQHLKSMEDVSSAALNAVKSFFGFGEEKTKTKMDVAEGDFFEDESLPEVEKEAKDKTDQHLKSIKDISKAALNAVKSFFGLSVGEKEKEREDDSRIDIAEGDFFEDKKLPEVEKEAKDKLKNTVWSLKDIVSSAWDGIKSIFGFDKKEENVDKEKEEENIKKYFPVSSIQIIYDFVNFKLGKTLDYIKNKISSVWGGIKDFFTGNTDKNENKKVKVGANKEKLNIRDIQKQNEIDNKHKKKILEKREAFEKTREKCLAELKEKDKLIKSKEKECLENAKITEKTKDDNSKAKFMNIANQKKQKEEEKQTAEPNVVVNTPPPVMYKEKEKKVLDPRLYYESDF